MALLHTSEPFTDPLGVCKNRFDESLVVFGLQSDSRPKDIEIPLQAHSHREVLQLGSASGLNVPTKPGQPKLLAGKCLRFDIYVSIGDPRLRPAVVKDVTAQVSNGSCQILERHGS